MSVRIRPSNDIIRRLPIVDGITFRTLVTFPPLQVRRVFTQIQEFAHY